MSTPEDHEQLCALVADLLKQADRYKPLSEQLNALRKWTEAHAEPKATKRKPKSEKAVQPGEP